MNRTYLWLASRKGDFKSALSENPRVNMYLPSAKEMIAKRQPEIWREHWSYVQQTYIRKDLYYCFLVSESPKQTREISQYSTGRLDGVCLESRSEGWRHINRPGMLRKTLQRSFLSGTILGSCKRLGVFSKISQILKAISILTLLLLASFKSFQVCLPILLTLSPYIPWIFSGFLNASITDDFTLGIKVISLVAVDLSHDKALLGVGNEVYLDLVRAASDGFVVEAALTMDFAPEKRQQE